MAKIEQRISADTSAKQVDHALSMLADLKMEDDQLFNMEHVDVEALKALVSELKRCTIAAEACLAEKLFSTLNIAKPPSRGALAEKADKRRPLQSITNSAATAPAADRKSVAFHIGKPAKPSRPKQQAPAQPASEAAELDQLDSMQRLLSTLDLSKQQPGVEEGEIVEEAPSAAAAAALPADASTVPRIPRLLVVVDTNELIADCKIDKAFLLQDYAGVDIVLPSQVAHELDGLKRHTDTTKAARARQANALLSTAARQHEPWLLCEPRDHAAATGRDRLVADERVLRCATTFARSHAVHPKDRVLLVTSDANLLLKAAAENVEAMPLVEARKLAMARHQAWRAAYVDNAAADAIAAARWASGGRAEVMHGPSNVAVS